MKKNVIRIGGFRCIVQLSAVLLLGGCATASRQADAPVRWDAVPAFSATDLSDSDSAADGGGLSPAAFYYILSGEIAGQRNRLDLSSDSYLRAARLVRNEPKVAARAARIALYSKDYKKAMEAASVWSAAEPDSVEARKIVASLQLKQGETDKALDNFVWILSSENVDFEKASVDIAQMIAGNTEKPYLVMDSLVQRFPGSAEMQFAYALMATKLKDISVAEQALERSLSLRPAWGAPLSLKAKIAAQSGDTEKARTIVEQALQVSPDDAELHLLYAKLLGMNKQYPQSAEHFQRVVELEPENADAQFALAIIQSAQGDFESAREGLLRLAKKHQHRQRAYLQLGQLAAENRLPDEALAWLDQVERGPMAFDAQIHATSVLVGQGRVDDALERLGKLRSQYPQMHSRIALREAELYADNQQEQKAYEVLNVALSVESGQRQLLYMRSLIADQLDLTEVAEADLKAILAITPNDANALNALGYILTSKTTRYAEAEQYLLRAIKMKPEDPAVLDSMGWLRYHQKSFEQSIEYLRSAYGKSKDAEIGAHLGEVLWVTGQREAAVQVLREAWEKDSASEALQLLRKQIPAAFTTLTTP